MQPSFSQFSLSAQLTRALAKLGFLTPTKVQQAAISPMMAGRDLLVQAPTGTGKTAAFGIPVVERVRPGSDVLSTVVLCPTRELAVQTADVLRSLAACKPGVRVLAVYGGDSFGRQLAALRRHPHILVATPGRLIDHMKRRTVQLDRVGCVVLDEADRMLDMGFRDDIRTILDRIPQKRQTVLFSATFSPEIQALAARYQKNAQKITVREEKKPVQRIRQYYLSLPPMDKSPALLDLLFDRRPRRALVFVSTKAMAAKLCEWLLRKGVAAGALHGDLLQEEREQVMRRYRSGEIAVLVATDVAARGIDVQEVDAVINYDLPGDADSYTHRIGRTGRGERRGAAYTLVTYSEYDTLHRLAGAHASALRELILGEPDEPEFLPDPPRKKRRRRRKKPADGAVQIDGAATSANSPAPADSPSPIMEKVTDTLASQGENTPTPPKKRRRRRKKPADGAVQIDGTATSANGPAHADSPSPIAEEIADTLASQAKASPTPPKKRRRRRRKKVSGSTAEISLSAKDSGQAIPSNGHDI